MANDNVILVNSSSTAVTITLPAPTNGRILKIKDSTGNAGTHNITINPHASETIDGASSKVINFNFGSVNLVSDGTNWLLDNLSNASGSGTVTSVALADTSTTPLFNISGSPITSSGTLDFALKTQSANIILAGPTTGSAAQPTFRSLVIGDLSFAGSANGVATLDSGGHIPLSQLPATLVEYLGTWNANTNTPTLANGTGTSGQFYIVSTAGSTDFGAGPIAFNVGDWVLYNGTIWERAVQSNVVQSVNGSTGVVTVNAINQLTGDATAGPASGSQSQALTLATVNSNTGSFGSSTAIPNFTVNGKGLITAAGTSVVVAPAGTLSGTTLNSSVVSSSLTSVGTLTSLTVSGAFSASNFSGSSSGTNTGDLTLAAFGSTPATNGASLSGQVLTLQPADATHGGGVSTTTQTLAGDKTLTGNTLIAQATASQATIGISGSTATHQINGGLQVTTNTVSSNYAIN